MSSDKNHNGASVSADDFNMAELVGNFQYWSGIPTFLGSGMATSMKGVDIALVGVPYNCGNAIEQGQYLGPRAVRCMSTGHHRVHRVFRLDPFSVCKIRDLGDPPMPNALDPRLAPDEVQAFFEQIHAAGIRPVSVGGDHTITLPILRAIAGAKSRHKGPVGIIHFDAHTDAYPRFPDNNAIHAGSAFYDGVLEGLIDPKRMIQIGIRGPVATLEQDDFARELGSRIYEMSEIIDKGVPALNAEIRRIVGDGPVYISWDMDALDPAYAPAVSDPEADGMTMREAMAVMHSLRGLDIIGGDVVEFQPSLDVRGGPGGGGLTVYHATTLFYEIVSLIADRLSQDRQ